MQRLVHTIIRKHPLHFLFDDQLYIKHGKDGLLTVSQHALIFSAHVLACLSFSISTLSEGTTVTVYDKLIQNLFVSALAATNIKGLIMLLSKLNALKEDEQIQWKSGIVRK